MIDVAERPAYSAAEAARYTGTSAATVARWRAGYTYKTQRGPRRSRIVWTCDHSAGSTIGAMPAASHVRSLPA